MVLENKLSITLKYRNLEARPVDQKVYISDIRSFVRATGGHPEINIKQSIDSPIDWKQLYPLSQKGIAIDGYSFSSA